MAGDDIYHININGLKLQKSPSFLSKESEIRSILDKASCTILNIQETHVPNETSLPKFLSLYKHLFDFIPTFSKSSDPSSGILICINKTEDIQCF